MSYFVGFDGGGTKTDCALLDGAGRILAEARTGPSNPLRVGFPKACGALKAAARNVLASASLGAGEVEGVCAGLAGAGQPRVARRIAAFLTRVFPAAAVHVTTDLEVALEAGVGASAGIVLVAGTGSAAFGRDAAGRTARAGGRGPQVGDEGSAYDIGRRAVAAIERARKRGAPATGIEGAVLRALKCSGWDALARRIKKNPDEVFPRIFPLVTEAAREKDAVAREILSAAAVALAGLARSVIEVLGLTEDEFVLAKSGGVFGRSAALDAAVDAQLARIAPRARVERLQISPAIGAARLAIRRAMAAQREE